MKNSTPKVHAKKTASRAMTTVVLASAMTLGGVTAAYAAPSDPIDMPDAALLECVNESIDPSRAIDQDVTEAEAATVIDVDCQSSGVVSLAGMERLVSLEKAWLNNNSIVSLAPLGGLTTLNNLSLNFTGVADSDLGTLAGLTNLSTLGLMGNDITDVTPLSSLGSLKYLMLNENSITEVSTLASLAALENLDLRRNTVADVAALASLSNLERLELEENSITDLGALSSLNLTTLTADDQTVELGDLDVNAAVANPVVEVNGDAVALDSLYDAASNTFTPTTEGTGSVSWNDGSNFSGTLSFTAAQPATTIVIPDAALRACVNGELGQGDDADITEGQAASITYLDCQGKGVADLEGLQYLTSLQEALLTENEIAEVSALSNLTDLELLSLGENNLTDISALPISLEGLALDENPLADAPDFTNFTNLRSLYLNANNLTDVLGLANLSNLQSLELGENNITEVPDLPTEIRWVYLAANNISDLSSLSSLTELNAINLDENHIADLSPLPTVSTIEIFSAFDQTVELGDLVIDAPVSNPVRDRSGDPVALNAFYDSASNTFTPTTLGAGSAGWTDDNAFTGTVTFAVVEADATGNDGDQAGGDSGTAGPTAGEPDVAALPATGVDSSLLATGGFAGLLLLVGAVLLGQRRNRRA